MADASVKYMHRAHNDSSFAETHVVCQQSIFTIAFLQQISTVNLPQLLSLPQLRFSSTKVILQ